MSTVRRPITSNCTLFGEHRNPAPEEPPGPHQDFVAPSAVLHEVHSLHLPGLVELTDVRVPRFACPAPEAHHCSATVAPGTAIMSSCRDNVGPE
jgi:hypothetical protein